MAVIINELEVILERPPQSGATPSAEPTPPNVALLQPHDVALILERQLSNRFRLLAH